MLKTSTSTSTFLYFAYGANMLSRRLHTPDRAPSAVAIDLGFVQGRRFSFGKVSRDGSGKSDLEATGNLKDRAYGVLFKINVKEKPSLDEAEGLGIGYSEANIQVVTATGVYNALTYVASYKESPLLPYQWYKASVIAGAVEHGLPAEYVEWLRTFEAQPDANTKRRTEREALIFGDLPLHRFQFDMSRRQAAVNEA
ncbi:gamma-glutamylcyclotransferase [Nitrosospira lacus]|uniref:Gamma-glutamylcyclotransferase n=1 Tax=Nitrosospira lacus TaxID=1288494 RepID=A0A1W6SNB7_9PROT|nr:gamma-glutamylcyclotransferase [Nitrosospira lacus]ARO87319.1 gamma-glutamylcyclotransferase [Nitrosospira lacus]